MRAACRAVHRAVGQRRLERVMSDNGSEFRPREFGRTVAGPGARQRFINADEPQTNGRVERVQGAILEECGEPAITHSLVPKQNRSPA